MKIKRLKVPEYKNIAIDLELRTDLITLLVGQNGMGKSNLLEILLLIFDELNQLAAGRRPKEGEMILTNYVLEYECRGHSYKAVKDRGLLTLWEPDSQFEDGFEAMLPKVPFEALPRQIIGYYSGENKRVRTLVAKHIKREESSKRRRYSKGEVNLFEPKRLFFAENRHSMLVLTTLLLYREHPVYGQQIKKVLQDVVHIGEWGRIEVRFRNPSFAKMGQLQKQHHTLKDYYELLLQGEVPEGANVFWGIRGNVDRLLSLLLNDAIVHERKFSIKKAERGSREFFELETIPADNEFRTQLFDEFPAPMDFLNTLEECYVLNMVDKLDVVLQKTGEKAYYPYLQLSEGEQQYLTVMGLIALAHSRDDETLFLLDEPDTHINPQWQRSYIKHILDLSNTEADKKSKVFFISTHSPLLVQANSPGSPIVDLLLFKKNEQGKVIIDTDEDVVKNWRIDQVLMSKYFDLPSARSSELDEFMQRRLNIIRGIGTEEDRKYVASKNVGFGYLPTGETMDEIEAMAYIHAEAKKLREKNNEVSGS